MEELQEHRDVRAPIGTCWEVLTDPELGARWLAFADEVAAGGELGVGQTLVARGSLAGIPLHATSEIDVFDEPTAVGWTGQRPFPSRFRFQLTELAAARTRIESSIAIAPGPFPVGTRMLMRAVRKQAARSADQLKALIEQQAAG